MASDPSPLRPTKSVVRKALRDILRPVIDDLVVLELYAGTGRVSEGLLREGAKKAFAVDLRDPPDDLDEEDIEWFRRDVDSFLRHGPPEPVGLVYLDPPYDTAEYQPILSSLASAEWLKPGGLIAVETGRDTSLPPGEDLPGTLQLKRNRRYGNSRLWIYQHEPKEST